jgi:hypothetical protein
MKAMNGHARDEAPTAPVMVPFAIPSVRQAGPASGWPQDDTRRWRHVTSAMTAVFAHRGWLAAIPVLLVNAVAFAGQLAFLRHHLPWTPTGQVLVAVTLESVAVYLAWQAHLALAADDSALRLRLGAYGFAAVIGVMNYSHWMAPHWRPTFTAVTFGLMSVSSPWLWSVHSRRQSRDALKARGLIEPHAVRLGATRWTWHPIRSAHVMWHATWKGENDPAAAIALTPDRKRHTVTPPPAIAAGEPSPEGGEDPSPDASADRQEDVSDAGIPSSGDAPTEPSPPVKPAVKPAARKSAVPPSARSKALAIMKGDPGLSDAEVMKRAKVSESTVARARRELAEAKS